MWFFFNWTLDPRRFVVIWKSSWTGTGTENCLHSVHQRLIFGNMSHTKSFFASHTKITFVFVCPLNERLIKKLLTKMNNLVKKGIRTYKTLTLKHKLKKHQCPQGSVLKVQHTLYSMARNSKRQEGRPEINWAVIHFSITYRMTIFSMTPSTRPVASNPKQNGAQHY